MTTTYARRLTILNDYGICARPAAVIVKTVSRFDADVTMTRDGNTVNGKSIMGVMTLEASQGTTIEVRATGPEAKAAIEKLTAAFNSGFDYGWRCLPIPKEHAEWLPVPPPPPPLPPFRILCVAFSLGSEAGGQRECLVRTILAAVRRRMRSRRIRLHSLDLRKRRCRRAVPGASKDRDGWLADVEPPRPFFLFLDARDAGSLLTLDTVPNAIDDLRTFLTPRSEEPPLSQEEISTLVHCYPWRDESGRYERRTGVSDEESDILATVFHRRYAYLREHCLILFRDHAMGRRQVAPDDQPGDLPELRKHLDTHGWQHADYADIKSFREIVAGALERWIDTESSHS